MGHVARLWREFDKFADEFDERVGRENDDSIYARRYIEEFVEAKLGKTFTSLAYLNDRFGGAPYDISVSAESSDLDRLAKRMSLVADHSVITHAECHAMRLISGKAGSTSIQARVPDLDALGRYLRASLPMLKDGRLVYMPNFESVVEDYGAHGISHSFKHPHGSVKQLIVNGRHCISDGSKRAEISLRLMRPMLVLDLPYIEGTSLEDYFSICLEESDSLGALQDYLRTKFLELQPSDDSLEVDLARLRTEIRSGVRDLEAEFRKVSRRAAVQGIGAGLATFTAALLALTPTEYAAHVPEIIGAGGGLWGGLDARINYLQARDELKTTPYYLLWLFERKAAH